ncbi:MAG: hypothetical protein J7501_06765 [Bdellovibrio sp.]|nr:hypothetical protein [Bdellovibrio sp.]
MKAVIALILLLSGNAYAGFRVNNGGGAWACTVGKKIRWIKTHDTYRYDLQKNVSSEQTAKEIYEERLKEAERFTNLKKVLDADPLKIEDHIEYVNTRLDYINDGHTNEKPPQEWCQGGSIDYVQVADYLINGTLLIDKKYWNHKAFSEADKAALLLHERIYHAYRKTIGAQSSDSASLAVQYLMQDLKTVRSYSADALNEPSVGARGASGVALYSVRLRCQLTVQELSPVVVRDSFESSRDYKVIAMKSWNNIEYGSSLDETVNNYQVKVVTRRTDGIPTAMQLIDVNNGVSANLTMRLLHAIFVTNEGDKVANITLTNQKSSSGASLDCWAY